LKQKGANPILSPHIVPRDLAEKPRPLYLDIVFDAKILIDKDGFIASVLSRVRESLEKLRAKRIKLWRGWVLVLKDRVEPGERIKIW